MAPSAATLIVSAVRRVYALWHLLICVAIAVGASTANAQIPSADSLKQVLKRATYVLPPAEDDKLIGEAVPRRTSLTLQPRRSPVTALRTTLTSLSALFILMLAGSNFASTAGSAPAAAPTDGNTAQPSASEMAAAKGTEPRR